MTKRDKWTHVDNDFLFRYKAEHVAKKYGISIRKVYELRNNRRRWGHVDGIAIDLRFMTEAQFAKKYDMSKRTMIRQREEKQ